LRPLQNNEEYTLSYIALFFSTKAIIEQKAFFVKGFLLLFDNEACDATIKQKGTYLPRTQDRECLGTDRFGQTLIKQTLSFGAAVV
jgi:hypothetical protein